MLVKYTLPVYYPSAKEYSFSFHVPGRDYSFSPTCRLAHIIVNYYLQATNLAPNETIYLVENNSGVKILMHQLVIVSQQNHTAITKLKCLLDKTSEYL